MKKIKEYALTTLGIVLTAIALEYFFFPNDIAAGGVSGIALVINGVTGWNISIMVFILNIYSSFCCFRKRIWWKEYICHCNAFCSNGDN